MNFILFYGQIESLNFFIGELADQFQQMGHIPIYWTGMIRKRSGR